MCFTPPSAPLTSEGSLMIHVEPSGPNYEMKLRGTAAEDERHRDGYVNHVVGSDRARMLTTSLHLYLSSLPQATFLQ